MSFIVGGVPRGGTTFFGQLFNVHEEVFCYFMETSLFRQLHAFGQDRPFPAENLPALEQWLRAQLWGTLVEGTSESRVATFRRLVRFREVLAEHGLDEPSGPGLRVWDARRFEVFLGELVDLFRAGLYGTPLFEAGLALLERHFGAVTGRAFLGEKTPDNVFYLQALQQARPALKGFCIVREPYSTLESMKRRALRNDHFFDSAFSSDVMGGIAEYYRYLRALRDLDAHAAPGALHVLRFEDLVRSPEAVMARAFAALGLDMTPAAHAILPQLSLPTDPRHLGEFDLSQAERRLVELVLGPMLRRFGYADASDAAGVAPDGFAEGVFALRGVHLEGQPEDAITGKWIARRADLLLLFAPHRRRVVLELGSHFPQAVEADGVTVRVSSGGVPLGAFTGPPSGALRIDLPLDAMPVLAASGKISAALLEIEVSRSFVPITVDGCGCDLRDLALAVTSHQFV